MNEKMSSCISFSDAKKMLGVSEETLKRWETEEILHPINYQNEIFYTPEELNIVKKTQAVTLEEIHHHYQLSKESLNELEKNGLLIPIHFNGQKIYTPEILQNFINAHKFYTEESHTTPALPIPNLPLPHISQISEIENMKSVVNENQTQIRILLTCLNVIFGTLAVCVVITVLIVIFLTTIFYFFPQRSSSLIGEAKTSTQLVIADTPQVLGASTDKKPGNPVISTLLKPFTSISLQIIKGIDEDKYQTITKTKTQSQQTIFVKDENDNILLSKDLKLSSQNLKVTDNNTVQNLSAEFIQGRQPGESVGNILYFSDDLTVPSLRIVPQNLASLLITSEYIATGSITTDKLASNIEFVFDNSITSDKIKAGSIEASDLAAQSITSEKIYDGTIATTDLANDVITSAKINDGAVTDNKLSEISSSNKVLGSAVQLSGAGGLENSSGLSLLRSCADSQILKWNSSGTTWECANDSTGGGGGNNLVEEGDVTVDATVTNFDFSATDFTISESPEDEVNISIDYTNSNIVRSNQNETISGNWTFNGSTSFAASDIIDSEVSDTLTIGVGGSVAAAAITGTLSDSQVSDTLTASNLVAGSSVVSNAEVDDDLTISGGSIDNSPIGSSTASTGAFTTLSSTGATTLGNNSSTVAINSNDWDIDSSGNITGIAFNANGTGNSLSNIDNADLTNDTLDFDKFANSLTLDESTDIAAGSALTFQIGNNITFQTTGSGSIISTDLSCTNCIGALEVSDLTLGTDTAGNYVASITAGGGLTGTAASEGSTPTLDVGAGNGITVNTDDIAIKLTTTGNSGSSSSNSGLEVGSGGLTLLKGCLDNEILKYTDAGGWACGTDASGGGSGTLDDAYNNGATITVDAYDLLFNLNDATNDYKLTIDNTTNGTINTAISITTTGGVSSVITTAIDLSDADIVTALALGSNDVTVGGATISSSEFALLDSGVAYSELTDSGTLTVSTVDINGGAIDGTSIGANAASTGAFTTLSSTGATTLGNNSATVAIDSNDWDISTTGTITGISFDANGTGNSISNIDNADLTNDTLDFDKISNSLTLDESTDIVAGSALNLQIGNNVTFQVTGTGAIVATDLSCTNCIGATEVSDLTLGSDTAGNYVATITAGGGLTGSASTEGSTPTLDIGAGNGITVNADDVTIKLTTTGNTGSNSSNSGLEVGSGGLTLLKGCLDNEILKYTDAGGWACSTDASGGGSGTLDDAYNNGATITVDAYDLLFNLNDATNDYKLTIDNTTNGTISTAFAITTTGGGSSVISTAIDLSDADIVTSLALGSNDVTVGGVTISSSEFALLDSGVAYSELTDSGTLTVTTVDINGGAIDGTAIGANSASTAAFTTLSSTGVTTIGNNSATVAIDSNDWDISTTGAITGVSFDANGTGNSISNIDNADLTNDTIDFDKISAALTLDEQTDITAGGATSLRISNNVTLTTTGSGAIIATDLSCTDCIGATEIADLTLGTDTAGNYVASVATGTGLTGGAAGSEGATLSLSVDQSTAFAWTASHTFTKTQTADGQIQDINLTLGDDGDTDTISGINIDVTSAATGDADTIYGINVANVTSANGTVQERAIRIGSGWDEALDLNGTLISSAELGLLDSGIALSELSDSGTLTAGTVDINGGAIDGTAIGANSASTAAFTTLSSTGATTLGNNSTTVAIDSNDWDISTTGTLTGVSFDANGTGNSLSNIDNADLTNDTLDFDKISNSLTLDEATDIAAGGALNLQIGNNVTLQTTGSGAIIASDLSCTNCIGATEVSDLTLGTDTAGNYVASVATSTGLTGGAVGSEGGALTLSVDQSTAFAWTGQQTITATVTAAGSLYDVNVTLGDDTDTDTVNGISIDATSAATGDADNLYALNIGNVTDQANVLEYAIRVGSGWQEVLDLNGTLLSSTEISLLDSGIALSELTDSGTLTAGTVDINGGAIDGVTIGGSSAGAGTFTTFTTTGTVDLSSDSGADTITIGQSGSTDDTVNIAGNISITDDQWSISAAGAGSFVSGTVLGTQTFTSNNIEDSGALTIKSATGANAITIDSGSTGNVNIGTSNNAKTIAIGTGTQGNTINVGNDNTTKDTINIGSSLDDVAITGDQWSITNAGVLTVASCSGCGAGGGSLDTAYNSGGSITVDAYDITFNLNDATNDYKFTIDNTTNGTIGTAFAITTNGGGSAIFSTAIDVSDNEIGTAIAIGSNDVTVGGATISSAEFALLDSGIALSELTDSGTLTAGTVDLNGGAIDGAAIGANSASTGAFTTLSTTGATTIGNNSATVAIDSNDWDISTTGAITGVSFDANGTGNSISNIDNADLTNDTLDFDKIAAGLTLDEETTISASGPLNFQIGNNVTLQTTGSGAIIATDLSCTNCIGATEVADLTLSTDTAGNYVASVATGTGLTGGAAGSEGATLSLSVDQSTAFAWTGQQSWTTTVTAAGSVADINVTLGDDGDADIVSGLSIDATSVATGDADNLYALNIGNVTDQANVLEYAIRVGSGWQNILDLNGTLLSASELGLLDSGVALSELTDSGTLTAGTVDINGGAIDGVTIGGSSAGAGTFTTFTSTGTSNLGNSTGAVTIDSTGTITLNDATLSVANQATTVSIRDNVASSFTIAESTNTYFLITTINSAPIVTLDTLETGGTMNFGASNFSRTINIGTGTAADTVHIGEGGTAANVITIGSDAVANTITIGSASSTSVSITDDNWSISSAGAASFASFSMSGAFAANGGITFDNSTDTLGAFTLAGTMDANSNIITNLGATTTDFTTSGALAIGLDAAEAGGALSVDNVAQTSDIFVAKDNGTMVFKVADGGLTTFDPATTGTIVDFALATQWTTGTMINGSYGSSTTQTGAVTGINLNFNTNFTGLTSSSSSVTGYNLSTPAITNSSNSTYTINGFNLGTAGALVAQTTSGATIDWNGIDIVLPQITTSNAGTVATADGIEVTIPASAAVVQTAGTATMNGINIVAPTTSGPASGTLNGLNIGNLTSAGNGTETAIKVGSGWDVDTAYVDTSTVVKLTTTDNSASYAITDNSNNVMLLLKDLSTNFGTLAISGGFMDINSYWGEEFANARTAANCTADAIQARGAGSLAGCTANTGVLSVDVTLGGTGTCAISSPADAVNGYERIAASDGNNNASCAEFIGSSTANDAQLPFNSDNLPVVAMKVRPSATDGSSNVRYFVGLGNLGTAGTGASTTAQAAMDTSDSGIYFTNCTAPTTPTCTGSTWIGVVQNGATINTVTCTGATISTTQFAYMRIEVKVSGASPTVNFYIDPDVSDGISEISCGSVTGTAITNLAWGFFANTNVQNGFNGTLNFDIDYVRVWQDDAAPTEPSPKTLEFAYDGSLTESLPDLNNADALSSISSIDSPISESSASSETKNQSTQDKSIDNLKQDIASISARLTTLEKSVATGKDENVLGLNTQLLDSVNQENNLNDLKALNAVISGTFKALGDSFLGNTVIAGDLTIDGTFSITDGKSINSFGCPDEIDTPINTDCGILYIQNSNFAALVDFFNGKVVIDKEGTIKADRVEANYISIGADSVGSGKISAGTTETEIQTMAVTSSSRIFLTPQSELDLPLYLGEKTPKKGFKVKIKHPATQDILFDWWVVEQK